MMGQGEWCIRAARTACVACALVAAQARGEGAIDDRPLADGQFHAVSQPAPGSTPAAPADQPLTQPPARPRGPSAPQPSAQARSFGSSRGPQSSAPSMIGDFFGGGSLQLFLQAPPTTINSNFTGFGLTQDPFDPNTPVLFSVNPNGAPPTLLSGVPGMDINGDQIPDLFPVPNAPPEFNPATPGPGTLQFINGQLVAPGNPPPGPGMPQFVPGYQLFLQHQFTPGQIVINAPNPGGGGGVGRVKIAENNSPLPRDRVFHNYSYFDNVPLTTTGVDVNRFIPGFEKTFFRGMASFEMRFPFAATLDSVIVADGDLNTSEVEFGNIGIPLKLLLCQNSNLALSIGLQVALPTADDTEVQLANGTPLVRIENESAHLMPFVGLLLTPNERLFMQAFVQVDTDTKGNPVLVTDFAGGLVPVGSLDDVTFLYVDLSMGYWLIRGDHPHGLTGVAPTLELHINTALDDPQDFQAGNLRVGNFNTPLDSTNLVVGTMFEWSQNTTLTLGYATPVSGDDRQFDGELRVIFNHRFGPQTRASRAQF